MRENLKRTMRAIVRDIEAVQGIGFSVATGGAMIDGVPYVQFKVGTYDGRGRRRRARRMRAADAREVADLLVRNLDKYDAEDRQRIMEYAQMFRETAERAEAGGLQ